MATSFSVNEDEVAQLIKEETPVNVYLKSGIKLMGTLVGADVNSVFLKKDGTQMVYKSAISTITPSN